VTARVPEWYKKGLQACSCQAIASGIVIRGLVAQAHCAHTTGLRVGVIFLPDRQRGQFAQARPRCLLPQPFPIPPALAELITQNMTTAHSVVNLTSEADKHGTSGQAV